MREHFTKRKKRKDDLYFEIRSQTRNKHRGQVELEFVRYACQLQDWDNHGGSFKSLGDALQDAKVIKDDAPTIIVNWLPKQVRVHTRKEERIEVIIRDV